MSRSKLNLDLLRVTSFVTQLSEIKGGTFKTRTYTQSETPPNQNMGVSTDTTCQTEMETCL